MSKIKKKTSESVNCFQSVKKKSKKKKKKRFGMFKNMIAVVL